MGNNNTSTNNNKHVPELKINPGSTSILLIFVTLCLVAFAVLCVVSANSDKKLGDKVATRSEVYYAACNKAQQVIAQIDNDLLTIYNNESSESDYYKAAGGNIRSFVIDIDSSQKLHVTLSILYPLNDGDSFYKITGWEIETIESETVIFD